MVANNQSRVWVLVKNTQHMYLLRLSHLPWRPLHSVAKKKLPLQSGQVKRLITWPSVIYIFHLLIFISPFLHFFFCWLFPFAVAGCRFASFGSGKSKIFPKWERGGGSGVKWFVSTEKSCRSRCWCFANIASDRALNNDSWTWLGLFSRNWYLIQVLSSFPRLTFAPFWLELWTNVTFEQGGNWECLDYGIITKILTNFFCLRICVIAMTLCEATIKC